MGGSPPNPSDVAKPDDIYQSRLTQFEINEVRSSSGTAEITTHVTMTLTNAIVFDKTKQSNIFGGGRRTQWHTQRINANLGRLCQRQNVS